MPTSTKSPKSGVEAAPELESVAIPGRDHDVRRKRPPALSFLLKMETARQIARIVSLFAVDAASVYSAILAALCVKAALKDKWDFAASTQQAYHFATFAVLLTVLLFARSGLYAGRGSRPGLRAVFSSLFWVMFVAIIYAKADRQIFSSYYIFWGSMIFSIVIVGGARWLYERVTGVLLRAAGYHRRTILVGTNQHIDAVAHALAAGQDAAGSPLEVVGFISLTPRPDNGLRSLGDLADLPEIITEHGIDEVIIADPAFPQQQAVELVDVCHQRGVRVRIAQIGRASCRERV